MIARFKRKSYRTGGRFDIGNTRALDHAVDRAIGPVGPDHLATKHDDSELAMANISGTADELISIHGI